jgi:hypothetical protein
MHLLTQRSLVILPTYLHSVYLRSTYVCTCLGLTWQLNTFPLLAPIN